MLATSRGRVCARGRSARRASAPPNAQPAAAPARALTVQWLAPRSPMRRGSGSSSQRTPPSRASSPAKRLTASSESQSANIQNFALVADVAPRRPDAGVALAVAAYSARPVTRSGRGCTYAARRYLRTAPFAGARDHGRSLRRKPTRPGDLRESEERRGLETCDLRRDRRRRSTELKLRPRVRPCGQATRRLGEAPRASIAPATCPAAARVIVPAVTADPPLPADRRARRDRRPAHRRARRHRRDDRLVLHAALRLAERLRAQSSTRSKGGYFRIAPAHRARETKQLYLPDTNVLITRFLTPTGSARSRTSCRSTATEHRHRLVRRVVCVRGEMRVRDRVRAPLRLRTRRARRRARHEHGVVFRSRELDARARGRPALEPTAPAVPAASSPSARARARRSSSSRRRGRRAASALRRPDAGALRATRSRSGALAERTRATRAAGARWCTGPRSR